jgi:hypothetical protein
LTMVVVPVAMAVVVVPMSTMIFVY